MKYSTSFFNVSKTSVQSNLAKGRVATTHIAHLSRPHAPPKAAAPMLHICCELPMGYDWAPHIRPKITPLPWTDPKPASCLDPSDLPSQTASICDQPFCHNAMDSQTDRHNGPTDGCMECPITQQAAFALQKATTQPNNEFVSQMASRPGDICSVIT